MTADASSSAVFWSAHNLCVKIASISFPESQGIHGLYWNAIGLPPWHHDLAFVLFHFLIRPYWLALQSPPRKRQQWNCLQAKLKNETTREWAHPMAKKLKNCPSPDRWFDVKILTAWIPQNHWFCCLYFLPNPPQAAICRWQTNLFCPCLLL